MAELGFLLSKGGNGIKKDMYVSAHIGVASTCS